MSESSPPARGSSRRWERHGRTQPVVPARAGIFPPPPWEQVVPRRRPRPRGDLPPASTACRCSTPSSPPARGSSVPITAKGFGLLVVPARAGIFPVRIRAVGAGRCRPRPRGDLPAPGSSGWTRSTSSPPARGSSLRRDWHQAGTAVVPARAGIFLSALCSAPHWRSRPRPRGDLPSARLRSPSRCRSSPPARGSSRVPARVADRRMVVPARAGIFPSRPAGRSSRVRRPRPRGDLPIVSRFLSTFRGSSPPARGSSPTTLRGSDTGVVVPARAGIFHRRPRDRFPATGRPRPRGDLPWWRPAWTISGTSSPPARGSSCRVVPSSVVADVVPARAGIFRGPARTAPTSRGRPRPRGDLPTWVANQTDAELVVPARAGIFPRGRARG